jgi:hypothetical protein
MKPATDIFITSQQMVASIVVLPLMYGEENLGGLYFTLETPSNFQNIKDMLMGFVNSIVLVLLQKLEGQLHQMWDVVVQVRAGGWAWREVVVVSLPSCCCCCCSWNTSVNLRQLLARSVVFKARWSGVLKRDVQRVVSCCLAAFLVWLLLGCAVVSCRTPFASSVVLAFASVCTLTTCKSASYAGLNPFLVVLYLLLLLCSVRWP